jgi:energy-coupling factor transporter ATP-binding protein EcfA2
LFEFKMSYKEPGYHKLGDPPFLFPPENVDSKLDANLIEIQGRNGTGKTTLLNCMALAMGYLDQEKELETKPALKRKLQDLDKNMTLEYKFRICCDKPDPIEFRIERAKGQKPKLWLNSKRVDPDTVNRKLDLVFLTEDDPGKVVDASLGKLARYFKTLEKGLVSLQNSLNKHLMNITEYRNFKEKEKEMLENIEKLKQNIEKKKKELTELQGKREKIELKNKIKEKLELLSNEEQINSSYNHLRKKYEGLKDKRGTTFVKKLYRERYKLKLTTHELREIDGGIVQICNSLKHYGISLQSQKLLEGDYSELNRLNQTLHPQKMQEKLKLQMINEMIEFFGRYLGNDIVPLIDKPVSEVLRELFRLKIKLASDRIFGLVTALNNAMKRRKETVVAFDKIQEKISRLSQKTKDLEDIGDLRKSFVEAEKKYSDLQIALGEGRTKLLSQWKVLRSIEGDPLLVRNQILEMDVLTRTEENMKSRYEENLTLLRENATKQPKHEKRQKRLQDLYERISRMRENYYQWIQILVRGPASARKDFESAGEGLGFGLKDYQKFVRAVGEYLGNQFEPVAFDYKLHHIKFFDIEKDTFTTKDDRQIQIDKLSQGQSKITTLTGSFKKMDSSKKKIVLIDEIADLDPENLQKVKATLKKKFAEGSLLLAVLVRPPRESSTKIIDITGWG